MEKEFEIIKLKNELTLEKEKLVRLSRLLNIEYQDFKSVRDMEMSIDLGENMREQLKNIFLAFEKEGINF